MLAGGEEDHAVDTQKDVRAPDSGSDPGEEGEALGGLDEQREPEHEVVAAAIAPPLPALRCTPFAGGRPGLSSWESEGNLSEAFDHGKGDRLDQMRAELAEVIMQQVQRLALVLKEENAKLKRQMEAMPQVICARLKETSRVDAEAPGTFVQRASSRTSEGPVWSSQNSGTIQDLQRHACNSQQVSEGGWSDDDAEQMQLAASAEQDGRQPGRPPSGRRTPQEKPSMRRRQQLPLLRDPQRRPSQARARRRG